MSLCLFALLITSAFICVGANIGLFLRMELLGQLLLGLGVCVLVACSAVFGAIATLHSFEDVRSTHINDGRDDVILTLRLGPFHYSRRIAQEPETSEPSK